MCLLSCWMQWGCIFCFWLTIESFQLHMLHPQNWSVLINHCALKKRHKTPILINLKNNRCKNRALKMSRENSSIIFSLISGSRVILIYSRVTWESLCRYPQITEFASWLKSCMKMSDPKIVPLCRNTQLLDRCRGNAIEMPMWAWILHEAEHDCWLCRVTPSFRNQFTVPLNKWGWRLFSLQTGKVLLRGDPEVLILEWI